MSGTWSKGYLGALEWMLGWQTSSTVERVHAAVGRCGAQRVLGRRRACRQARNGRGHWAQALLPLGQRNQWSWEESRDWFLLQGSVHQMHGLKGNHHSIKQKIRLCLWPRQTKWWTGDIQAVSENVPGDEDENSPQQIHLYLDVRLYRCRSDPTPEQQQDNNTPLL